jgi:hypothetical protein
MAYRILSAAFGACLAGLSPAHALDCSPYLSDETKFKTCLMMDNVGSTMQAMASAERVRVCMAEPRGEECRKWQGWAAETDAYNRRR